MLSRTCQRVRWCISLCVVCKVEKRRNDGGEGKGVHAGSFGTCLCWKLGRMRRSESKEPDTVNFKFTNGKWMDLVDYGQRLHHLA